MFNLNLYNNSPVYLDIVNNIIQLIMNGTFKGNEKLPSIRNLSQILGINHNTVQKAYVELENRGYIYSLVGKGMFVQDNLDDLILNETNNLLKEMKNYILKLKLTGISKKDLEKIIQEVY
ncbi:GntR family transcriptional regulator [Mycoplasma sp. P36-A1]|uniref:GntR family transcriptional regulator n=1 Tax=Mycoplasma sp. P36-A1 TaxID=3252900 RepID=UPI003C2AC653